MRTFMILLALSSSLAWAQTDDFKTSLDAIDTKMEDQLFRWRNENRFNQEQFTPISKAKAFRDYYREVQTAALTERLKLYEETCSKTRTHCLTPAEKTSEESKVRVAIGYIERKVALAEQNAGAQPEERPATRNVASEERRPPEVEAPPQRSAQGRGPGMPDIPGGRGPGPGLPPGGGPNGRPPEVVIAGGEGRNPGSTPEVKPEERPEVQPQNGSEVQTENTPEVKPEEPQTEVTPEARPEGGQEVRPENQPEVRPEVKPEEQTPEVRPEEPRPEARPVVTENEDEKSPRNYNPDTCKWVKDMPRKVVSAPGCGRGQHTKVCVGYVVCEQKEGGGKFVRMSTCGADKCGGRDSDAVSCTKDQYYFSSRPMDESKHFVSPKLKEILSSEQ